MNDYFSQIAKFLCFWKFFRIHLAGDELSPGDSCYYVLFLGS